MSSQPLVRGQTQVAIEQKRDEKLAEAAWTPGMIFNTLSLLIVGWAYVFLGQVMKQPEACKQPWSMWFSVAGIVCLSMFLLQVCVVGDIRTMYTGASSDSMFKKEIYTEQGRSEEAAVAEKEFQEKGGVVVALKVGIGSLCIFCLAVPLWFGWLIWGVVMACSGTGCNLEIKFFWWVFSIACGSIAIQLVMEKAKCCVESAKNPEQTERLKIAEERLKIAEEEAAKNLPSDQQALYGLPAPSAPPL